MSTPEQVREERKPQIVLYVTVKISTTRETRTFELLFAGEVNLADLHETALFELERQVGFATPLEVIAVRYDVRANQLRHIVLPFAEAQKRQQEEDQKKEEDQQDA